MEQINEMQKLRSFHNDPKIKKKYLNRVIAHRKADKIIKGKYWQDGKGCAVGCTIEDNEHSRYETELGIPEGLAHLEDWLFENIPNGKAMKFPEEFLKAISVGADLTMTARKFYIAIHEDTLNNKEVK